MTMRIRFGLVFIVLTMLCISAPGQEGTRDVASLIEDLKDENSSIRASAAESLGSLRASESITPLIEAFKDENASVRVEAIYALANIGEPAVSPLIQALTDTDRYVRQEAAKALGKINDTRAVDPLIQSLWDEDYFVRSNAAESLGNLGDTRAIEPLILTLTDDDEYKYVRGDAAWALGKLKDTRAIGPLILALEDEDGHVRGNAALALGTLNDTRAAGPLIEALKDEDEYVRRWAAWALGKIKDTSAIEPLESALNDEDEEVRTYAAESLGELNDTKAKEVQSHPGFVSSANLAEAQSPQSEPVNTVGAVSLSDMNEMLLYENAQYGFEMSHPTNWIVQEPDANDQGIVVGFLVPGEDVNNPATYLLVQIEKLPSGQKITMDLYSQAVRRNLEAAMPDLKISTEDDISIGGQPGHAIVYNLASQDTTFRVLKAWTLRGEKAYVFTYNAPDDRYDEFARDISKIIGSLNAA